MVLMFREKMRVKVDEDRKIECPACGTVSARKVADFCLVCGKDIGSGYQPLDMIRSSYRLQGRNLSSENQNPEAAALFDLHDNSPAEMAWACTVYAMVPYLGILFTPLAVIFGSFGLYQGYHDPNGSGYRRSVQSVALSVALFGIQVFLWWLLYAVPKLGRTI